MSLPCLSVKTTKNFYIDNVGASVGRSTQNWVDINLFGHQLTFIKVEKFNFHNPNYVFEGKTALKDFFKIIKLEDESLFENKKGEAETVAGFVLEISKSFPKLNSKINFENYVFTIEALDRKRIKLVKFTIT